MLELLDIITIDLKQLILPIIYIILGFCTYKILKRVIEKATTATKNNLKSHQKQRINTVRILILNIIKYIIVVFVILAILANFGINVKSIVAGLGITTAIVGLAFQDLAKDLIAGISIITEAQYEIGDTIEVDGFMGEVIFIGLKTTRIRNYKGATKIIANHNMDKIINYSLHSSLAVVDVSTGYEHSSKEVEDALEKLRIKLKGKIPNAKGDLQIWGINELADSGVIYRLAVEVDTMQQFTVERYLRKEIKEVFDKENIKIPYSQIEVHNGK